MRFSRKKVVMNNLPSLGGYIIKLICHFVIVSAVEIDLRKEIDDLKAEILEIKSNRK